MRQDDHDLLIVIDERQATMAKTVDKIETTVERLDKTVTSFGETQESLVQVLADLKDSMYTGKNAVVPRVLALEAARKAERKILRLAITVAVALAGLFGLVAKGVL